MPERPLLILPEPGEPVERKTRPPNPGKPHFPSRERQVERLAPQFTSLQTAFAARRARLRTDAAGEVPEQVIVLETVGSIEGFINAVRHTEGLEWLAEIDEEDIPPDDDFFATGSEDQARPETRLAGRLFLVFANDQAFEQMLSFWDDWKNGVQLPRGLRRWSQLFGKLREVRAWGVRDRLLDTGVLEDWRDWIEGGSERVPCEIELWFRPAAPQRVASRQRVGRILRNLQGSVIQESVIEEIGYHGLLVDLPVAFVRPLVDGISEDVELIQCQQIQFFRAAGQAAGILRPGEGPQVDRRPVPPAGSLGLPVVALLDGLPLQNHPWLVGRLMVDDVDGFEDGYEANDRRHGTAMASLIVHGDKNADEPPLSRTIYVRPVLRPDARNWRSPRDEAAPERTLFVDLIHRAVRRLFEPQLPDSAAVAPQVVAINLSIGIRDRPFLNTMSPLARLIDWLAWKYRVLFIISAGNYADPIAIDVPQDRAVSISAEEMQTELVRAVASDARHRRLLSPAEAINALTVAALHQDSGTEPLAPRLIDPYVGHGLPSLINAQGMGYRRSIKPDILAPGGRLALYRSVVPNSSASFDVYDGTLPPGHLVAAPGVGSPDGALGWRSRGTSNSAAITSRTASILFDVLEELRAGPRGQVIDTIPRAVLVKTLLVHAAIWGEADEVMRRALLTPQNRSQFKEYVTRLVGYGAVNPSRATECTPQMVTALGGGTLRDGQAHVHTIPLPPSLSGVRAWRRLTITLAWITPVNPFHHSWRRSHLWFEPPMKTLKVERAEADWHAVQRGTCQHEVLEGSQATAFVDGDVIQVQINCRADAGPLQDPVPYALALTLEVAEVLGLDIYSEVSARVAAQVRVANAP